jgi:hypothetical protein
MENVNPDIRPPQRFVNRVGKYKVTPPRKFIPWGPQLKDLIKDLRLNPPCLPGLGSKRWGYTHWRGEWPKRENEPRRNDPCPCGSGLKYKKCCLINPKENETLI